MRECSRSTPEQPLDGVKIRIADEGDVKPTMKVKRKFIYEKYGVLIESMY